MKTRILVLMLCLMLVIVAAACAIADAPVKQGPPVTLSPLPELVFTDDVSCDDTSALESWLQSSTFMMDDFLAIMKTAAGKRGDIYDDVIALATLRDQVFTMTVPDCAVEPHNMIADAMKIAVTVFQEYNNGDREELGGIVDETKGRFEGVGAFQTELTDRLEQQYKNQ